MNAMSEKSRRPPGTFTDVSSGPGRAPRPRRWRRRASAATVWFMAWLLAFQQPMLVVAGEIAADSTAAAAHRPQVDTAGNGVALVDIVTPNAAGLSHNKYPRFDVDTRGAILIRNQKKLYIRDPSMRFIIVRMFR